MKISKIYGLVLVLLSLNLSPSVYATAQFGPKSVQTIKSVTLAESVKLDDSGKSLKRVAQGLRQKKVVFVWASVYVAQFFSNGTPIFSSLDAFRSSLLRGMPVVASMTFVRDVGVDKIIDGFKDVLKENSVDAASAPITDFLAAVKKVGDVKDGQTYFFEFTSENGKEKISFQSNGNEYFNVKEESPGLHIRFLNLWLGKPVDSGLVQLQEQFLKP